MTELLTRSKEVRQNRELQSPAARYRFGLSVIVPVGPGDSAWALLLPSLADLAETSEICFVATQPAPAELPLLLEHHGIDNPTRWIVSPPGRARQMNEGAAHAEGAFLWFLHADSQVSRAGIADLYAAIGAFPAALHFFDLAFARDRLSPVVLNEWGVRFRSHVLRLPFGDQGLCLHRELFDRLGPFDEQVAYGEDHLLVWNCHGQGVPLHPVGATLTTSPRKYHDRGWLTTTALHAFRTWRQAVPQLVRLLGTVGRRKQLGRRSPDSSLD